VLLKILPDAAVDAGDAAAREEDPALTEELANEGGVVTVQNPCLSGGAIELFLEPVLPAPRMIVAGDSPIVAALQRLGPELGLAVVNADAPAGGDLAVVVAAHGRDELGVLRAALAAEVPYVGLVASRKRGAAVLEQLGEAGVPRQQLDRVETPAGIDIAARTAPEIALSILARVVAVWRQHAPVSAPAAARPQTAVDPICGMTIVVATDTPSLVHGEQTVYFCCMGCKLTFEERHGHAALTR
jgi:xanthine dehydrogenase accessory factor